MTAMHAVLLRPDNFTPPGRTPWGGTRLCADLKRSALALTHASDAVVGESWEVSVEPDFPAYLDDGTPLSTWIAQNPQAALGEEHARGRTGTALLVKLIDTAEPLSVQIHPADDFAGLGPEECGKPESWYVVDREPGAGLYLGFTEEADEAAVRASLEGGRPLSELLRFVPVEPGDFFVIDAGTPHAIGAGLLLVEPQHVIPGRRGVTYRYWDWDRRYDASGRAAKDGQPRPLHVEQALRVTRWDEVRAASFIDDIRVRAGTALTSGPAACTALTGPGGVRSSHLSVRRLSGSGCLRLPDEALLRGITVLAGSVRVGGVTATRGRSCVVPACLGGAEVELREAHAIVSSVL